MLHSGAVLSAVTQDGALQLKFAASLPHVPYEEILEHRFGHPPHPEIWDPAHGGYFEGATLDHPEKLQTFSLGMIFGRLLLGAWLLDFPMGQMPLYCRSFNFESLGGEMPAGGSLLASDSAFRDFLETQRTSCNSPSFLAKETVDEVLADEDFIRDWRSMLQYKSADRPTAAEILERATWTIGVVPVTLHAPQLPLDDDSAVACIGLAGTELASCKLSTHETLASIRSALAQKLGLQRQDVSLSLPCGQLLIELDDARPLVDCLQIHG